MKKICLLFLVFNFTLIYSQVGIGTTSPTADLDVNGTLRIRTTSTYLSESAAKDSILVSDDLGNISRISSKKIIESHIKTFIKGNFSSGSVIGLSLVSNTAIIPFGTVDFDVNSEYSTVTNVFTAKQDGIYDIYVQIKASGIGVTTNYGVQILKNGSVISQNSFANVGISVLGIGLVNVTSPIRSTQTLLQLVTGDTVQFNVVSNLAGVSLLGNNEDCYFTIHQVR
jgi:hypothetical protein